jgi:hypothetical protein
MELRHLRYFTAVVQWKGYREASRRLHVAQPAISRTVANLEIGHRGAFGRNCIATGQTTHSSTSTTKIGHAISGAGNAKAIATWQLLMLQTLHHQTIAICGNWMAPCLH